MTTEGNGSQQMPLWAKVLGVIGLPGFIALYVLGAIPLLPPPFYQVLSADVRQLREMTEKKMLAHEQSTQELVRLVRVDCVRKSRTPADIAECGIRPVYTEP